MGGRWMAISGLGAIVYLVFGKVYFVFGEVYLDLDVCISAKEDEWKVDGHQFPWGSGCHHAIVYLVYFVFGKVYLDLYVCISAEEDGRKVDGHQRA